MIFRKIGPKARGAAGDRGFTLIEVVVVVFIISLFAALTVPKFMDVGQLKINRSATHIAHTVTYLYSQAAAHHLVVRLVFDLNSGKYYPAIMNKKGEFEPTKFPLFSFGTVGDGIAIKKFVTLFGGGFNGGTAYLHLLPDGFAEKAVIMLEDSTGRKLSLVVEPLMGNVRTISGEVELDLTDIQS